MVSKQILAFWLDALWATDPRPLKDGRTATSRFFLHGSKRHQRSDQSEQFPKEVDKK